MKEYDIQEQDLNSLRRWANELISWKLWAILIAFILMAAYIFYQSREIKKLQLKDLIESNETKIGQNKAAVEANSQKIDDNDTANENQAVEVEKKGKKAYKILQRPIGKPEPVEMDVMVNELLNVKEL